MKESKVIIYNDDRGPEEIMNFIKDFYSTEKDIPKKERGDYTQYEVIIKQLS
jgi:hypothetical protein